MRQVPKAVKEERPARRRRWRRRSTGTISRPVGSGVSVLFEQPKDGRYFGHAPNYMEVLADGRTCITRCGM